MSLQAPANDQWSGSKGPDNATRTPAQSAQAQSAQAQSAQAQSAQAQSAQAQSQQPATTRRGTIKPRTAMPVPTTGIIGWLRKNIRKLLTLGGISLIIVGLSYADGFFTLSTLQQWFSILETNRFLYAFRWLIHLAITAISVYLIPFGKNIKKVKDARKKWLESAQTEAPSLERDYDMYLKRRKGYILKVSVWFFVVAFNVGTSTTGIYQRMSGSSINLFGGITFPDGGTPLRIGAAILGFILAFGPEVLGNWIEDEWKEG